MLATGVFLNPHLNNLMTDVKLAAVLVLSLNGIMLIPLMRRLARLPSDTVVQGSASSGSGPICWCVWSSRRPCWWTAIIIGFINAEF